MKGKLSNQFFINYLVIFILVVIATTIAFSLLSFSSTLASTMFVKSKYTASSIMKDDYKQIDASTVVKNGGIVQIVDKNYQVVFADGKDKFLKSQMSAAEFTDFLTKSKSIGIAYHHDILYNSKGEFWIIVSFPASIRLGIDFVFNSKTENDDFNKSIIIFGTTIIVYLLLLAMLSYVYSKISALQITRPLRKLCDGTRLLLEGDYSARVDLRLKNEFAELQNTFNDMAERIGNEIELRKKSENDRKQLILDISHDLKNPMSSIQGYSELYLNKPSMPEHERNKYIEIINQNSKKANSLLNELFELSQLDSPEFKLKLVKTDICEYLRQLCGEFILSLEQAKFNYDIDIPEKRIYVLIDTERFKRIIQNLMDNALRYNPEGTTIFVKLEEKDNQAIITFCDDGHGIPKHLSKDILKPFVRADFSRNSKTGGSGLGLSIARKIAIAHGGELELNTDEGKGCNFKITIPKI